MVDVNDPARRASSAGGATSSIGLRDKVTITNKDRRLQRQPGFYILIKNRLGVRWEDRHRRARSVGAQQKHKHMRGELSFTLITTRLRRDRSERAKI